MIAEAKTITIDSYESWQDAFFTPSDQLDPTISGPWQDPNGDGSVNLLEYVSGGNPYVREQPALQFMRHSFGSAELVLPWAEDVTDVSWDIQTSTDLLAWQTIPGADVSATHAGRVFNASFPMPNGRSSYGRLLLRESP